MGLPSAERAHVLQVVQQCTDYACSRLLAVAYGQLRRQLSNAHLAMTVKVGAMPRTYSNRRSS